MSDHALIIGKFYPPHAGHHFLIDLAASECRTVTVLVLGHPREEASLPMKTRQELLNDRHPGEDVVVLTSECDLPVDYESREATHQHARHIWNTLGAQQRRGVDVVYSSEPYGADLAEDLTNLCQARYIDHRMVDQARTAFPVHASSLRRNMAVGWDYLAPATKAHFTKRFVICGAESSGTTTLARGLAERFQTIWVPEWGRMFSEAAGLSHRWTSEDFDLIAGEHLRQEELLARHAGPVMFCDTDAYATAMFHQLYMHAAASKFVWTLARGHELQAEAYFITDDNGVAFEDDGYRLFASQRKWATAWLREHLPHATLVSGAQDVRLGEVSSIVEESMRWYFAPAGDE